MGPQVALSLEEISSKNGWQPVPSLLQPKRFNKDFVTFISYICVKLDSAFGTADNAL